MKIAIVGSRKFSNLQTVIDYIDKLPADTVIVSGGAKGVDKTAEERAKARGLGVLIFIPDWATHGKSAGFIRNELIIKEADETVAYWDKTSNGTKHSISLSIKYGKPTLIITPDGPMTVSEFQCL